MRSKYGADTCDYFHVSPRHSVDEGLRSFREKRAVNYDALRDPKVAGESPDWPWGRYAKTCGNCGATRIPEQFEFCGRCGKKI